MSSKPTTDLRTIAIAGGIGSGKSVVSRALAAMGMVVYDCDSRARRLMDSDPAIHRQIAASIAPDVIADSSINRKRLAEIVFADGEMLKRLNAIVHHHVRADISHCVEELRRSGYAKQFFVETAILYESQLDRMVDAVWMVDAPVELRIRRVMARNAMTRAEVEARIASQHGVADSESTTPPTEIIVNDGVTPILPQLWQLLQS